MDAGREVSLTWTLVLPLLPTPLGNLSKPNLGFLIQNEDIYIYFNEFY